MNELVEKLKNKENFVDAYLVLKNLLCRDIDNPILFKEYIDLTLEIASYQIEFSERKQYINEANSALVIFSESAKIDEQILQLIKDSKSRIEKSYQTILAEEQESLQAEESIIIDENTKHLNELSKIYIEIQESKTQKEFDASLEKIESVENSLKKDFFTSTQQNTYETLTKQYSKGIGSKMEAINRNELLDYNKKAVKSFNDVFTAFRNEPTKYKNESNLKAIMTSKFFSFDSSMLFNETLVFYNHVYSVIFQEVNDSLKYKLTEWALNTTKLMK